MTITVVIADDQALLRAAFQKLLDSEPGISVVGEAADGVEAVSVVRKIRLQVVLLAPSVTRRLIAEFVDRPPPAGPRQLPELSPRETEVLIHLARASPTGRSPGTSSSAKPQ